MFPTNTKISLVYFVTLTLLLVGLLPLLLVGWLLSDRSAKELRTVENRYQIQLVQEKASQIEMFGRRYGDLVRGLAEALELSNSSAILASDRTGKRLANLLKENPDVLALYVKPADAESVSLFRPSVFEPGEIDSIAGEAAGKLTTQELSVGAPRKTAVTGETVMTLAAPVIFDGGKAASVVAIVSLRDISRAVVGSEPSSEDELWKNGLPIIFVVDQVGNTMFHPDTALVDDHRPQTSLKIVSEWQEANSQIQSGLVPFTAVHGGASYDMIGAYSTARFAKDISFGVIAMQDERKALASVGEMRTQTWIISIAFALAALSSGGGAAKTLTSPILQLAAAAEKIASVDLSVRVGTKNITEIGTLGAAFDTMSDKLEDHIASLAHAAKENRELFVGTVKALAAAIDGKDKYTRGHSERVSRISVAVGRQMGMSEVDIETLRISALLHDVGKIAIDDSILKKPAALTDAEYDIMKTHPQSGYKIMSQIPAMKEFLPGMYMHHEMVNGQGYPQGLTDEQIPLQAKIVSVADAFDAMTIDRPYQKGMLLPDALKTIKNFVGTRYDAEVVDALVRGCDAGEIGKGIVQFMANNPEAFLNRPDAEGLKVA
ncbi:MAG: HD domain-containing phosphohydrolase [Pyrinomonadaceae bacterium]